jgi:hypothetical protein
MNNSRDAYAAWKQADALAREMETELAQTWERYSEKSGDPPTQELIAEVSLRRSVANDKLTLALAEIGCVQR